MYRVAVSQSHRMADGRMHGAWILAGLYVVIMAESATIGVLFHATFDEVLRHANTEVEQRDAPSVIIVSFVGAILVGFMLTVPCLCYSVQNYSASSLIPYMVWRMLFSSIIMVSILVQHFAEASPPAFSSPFYGHHVPVVMVEVLVGTMFFSIAFRAYREFVTHRLRARRFDISDS